MGCVISTNQATRSAPPSPRLSDAGPPPGLPPKRSAGGRLSTNNGQQRSSNQSFDTRESRRSSATLQGGLGLWMNSRASNRTSSGSTAEWEKGSNDSKTIDPLGLGKDSDTAVAPSQWLVVMGTRSSGKSTLIRQIKLAHDGSDVAETMRLGREAHKAALSLFKVVVREASASLNDEPKKAADRLLALKRRAHVTEEVAQDIRTLLGCPEVKIAEAQVLDPQARRACRHYCDRVDELADEDYVPMALDLLHMAMPTIGQQETRVVSFPGGPLSLFEMTNEARTSIFHARASSLERHSSKAQQEIFGVGIRGVLFVASLLDFESAPTATGDRRRSSNGLERLIGLDLTSLHAGSKEELAPAHPVNLRPEAMKMWRNAQSAARASGVPCFLVLSKRDLLHEAPNIPQGVSVANVEASIRTQLLECKPSELAASPAAAPANDASPQKGLAKFVRPVVPGASEQRTCALDLLDADDGMGPLMELVTQQAFPELEFDDEAISALGEAVHVCLCLFCSKEGLVLSKSGALPIAKWQSNSLLMEDHNWLHELPRPMPNPKATLSEHVPARFGESSPNQTRALFWNALVTLSDQLGGFVPDDFGSLHAAPLLTTTGALLVVLRQDFETPPTIMSKSRSLKWRPMAQVASKLSRVAQAAELERYRKDGVLSSYMLDVREMLASKPARELMPAAWLEQLRHACTTTPFALSPGTHILAMYTRSTRDGLQMLVPREPRHAWLPPCVKISDGHLSVDDWAQLCEIQAATTGGPTPKIPSNWSAANDWLGPELGSEKQFTALQKFYFGVVGLRQRLERDCGATRDDMRYSKALGAVAMLSSLGQLYTPEIILADPSGSVQLLLVCNHCDVGSEEQFPKALRWTPFTLFEAHLYRTLMPTPHDALSVCKDLVRKGASMEFTLRKSGSDALRDSLRGSGEALRTSSLSNHSASSKVARGPALTTSVLGMPLRTFDEEEDERALNELWESLRWTKRVVLQSCLRGHEDFFGKGTPLDIKPTLDRRVLPPKQRMEQHVRVYQETLAALMARNEQTHKKMEQLTGMLAADGSCETMITIEGDKTTPPAAARRKLSFTSPFTSA